MKFIGTKAQKVIVEPPNVMVKAPEGFLNDQLIAVVNSFTPVQSVTILPTPGHAVFCLPSMDIAKLLYSAVIPTAPDPMVITTRSSDKDEQYEKEMGGPHDLQTMMSKIKELAPPPTLNPSNLAGNNQLSISLDKIEFRRLTNK